MFLKNVFFIVVPTGESWSENLVKKRLGTFEKNPIFCLQLSAGRQERINFIFRCVGFCGGLRRFLRGLQLSTSNYPPHPAVLKFYLLVCRSLKQLWQNNLPHILIPSDYLQLFYSYHLFELPQ
jgi:hypothetical protein